MVSTPRHDPWGRNYNASSDCEDLNYNGICDKDETMDCYDYDWDGICDEEEYGGGGSDSSDSNNDVDKILIDDSFKNEPCLKNIYDKMGKGAKFNEYLKKFDQDMSVADLKFTADNSFKNTELSKYHNALAITKTPLTSNEIVIKFNTDPNTTGNILNEPDVLKAVAMIHEVLHAEMFRKMLDAVRASEINQTTLNWTQWTGREFHDIFLNNLEDKYFGIFDYFTRYNYGIAEKDEPNDWQHEQMAKHYRDVIKQALTDYDPRLTDSQKEALSWTGLNEANIKAWQNLDEDPNLDTEQEQNAITSRLSKIRKTFPNGCN